MKILWSDLAAVTLKLIYQYYKNEAGPLVAKKIRNKILLATDRLKHHPDLGAAEENLLELSEGHRSIVTGNYKIIYKRVEEGILITDVFDTRQDPSKLNNPLR